MGKVPKRIDGARVLYHTSVEADQDGFGCFTYTGGQQERIAGLAVCRYSDNKKIIFLFLCNEAWEIIGDLQYETVNAAIEDATRYYGGSASGWIKAFKTK